MTLSSRPSASHFLYSEIHTADKTAQTGYSVVQLTLCFFNQDQENSPVSIYSECVCQQHVQKCVIQHFIYLAATKSVNNFNKDI